MNAVVRVDRELVRGSVIAGVITTLAALLLMSPDLIGFFFDDAIYALVAQALANGDGFTFAHLPGSPPAIHYPPLWSLLLSVGFKWGPPFPANAGWLRLINPMLIGGASMLATVFAVRGLRFPVKSAVLLVLVGFVSVQVQFLVNTLLSETLFLLLFFAVLVVAERAWRETNVSWWVAVGVLAGLSVLTRTLGFGLVLGAFGALLLDRRWRALVAFTVSVGLTLLPWQLFVWKSAPGFPPEIAGSYGNYLSFVLSGYAEGGASLVGEVVRKNIVDSWDFLGVPMQPYGAVSWRYALGGLAVAAMLLGAVFAAHVSMLRMFVLATLGYIAAVIVWPFHVERFLWGLWPAFILLAAYGMRELWEWRGARLAPVFSRVALVCGTVLLVGNVSYNVGGIYNGHVTLAPSVMSSRNLPVLRYVNSREDLRNEVVAADVAAMASLYSGLQLVPTGDLKVADHVRPANVGEAAQRLANIDARYRPTIYVFLRGPGMARAMPLAKFVEGRTFEELPSGDPAIQLFRLRTP